MAWPLARVVDSLDRGNVLFDFNPGRDTEQQMWVAADGFDYGTPEFDNSALGLVEGARTLSMGFRARGRGAEGAISRLSELLTRSAPGYLMWQTRPDSEPVWFRLHRNVSANPLDFSTVWADDADASTWRWKVDLVADAFALGARVDLPPTRRLVTPGSSISSPVEITEPILGDAPAPLNLDIDAGDLTGYTSQVMSWAMDPAMTVSPWAGANGLNLTFNGDAFTSEDIGPLPQTVPPGQYRALLYVTRSTSSGSARWSVGPTSDGMSDIPYTRAVTTAPGGVVGSLDGWWVDCGRVNLPTGMNFEDMPEDALPQVDWKVRFNGNTGSAKWKLSNFTLIPVRTVMSRAATTVLGVDNRLWPPDGGQLRVEAERERAGAYVDGKPRIGQPSTLSGSFPRVHPGARNFVMFLPRTAPVTVHSYGTAGETTMWYHPRHLHVGSR